jgi:protein-tyrosine phosphatase
MLKKIIGNLYLGNHSTVLDDTLLQNNNINTVINCTRNHYNINNKIVNIVNFPSNDPPSNTDFLFITNNTDKIIKLINKVTVENDKKVIIFCHKGQHRSVTLCILYLMDRFKINSSFALYIIKKIHPESFSHTGASTYYILKYFDSKYNL